MARLIYSLNLRGGRANIAAAAAVSQSLTKVDALCDSAAEDTASLQELLRLGKKWNGLGVIVHRDALTGTWIFIALHDASLGPMVGGCRINTYETAAAGLQDAMRLAEAMTYKWAIIGHEFGGAKAVLAVPRILAGAERAGLLSRFGLLLESLNGIVSTGQDLGTTPHDINVLAQATQFVHGINHETGEHLGPGPYTAIGVLSAIRTSLERVFGNSRVTDRSVLIEGAGHVGRPLARMLSHAGATLLISETNESLAQELSRELSCQLVGPESVHSVPCDVYSPCALGGVLTRGSALRLRCRIVAGAANNQLQEDQVAEILHGEGILYAPDYVVNAGGAIALPMFQKGSGATRIRERVEKISDTLTEIFTEAACRNESPLRSAHRLAERRITAHVLKRNDFTLLQSHDGVGLPRSSN